MAGLAQSAAAFDLRFTWFIQGHWLDSIGNSITVCVHPQGGLTAAVTPLVEDHRAQSRVLTIWLDGPSTVESPGWRCNSAYLEFANEVRQRIVWNTRDGRRNIWSRDCERQPAANGDGCVANGYHGSNGVEAALGPKPGAASAPAAGNAGSFQSIRASAGSQAAIAAAQAEADRLARLQRNRKGKYKHDRDREAQENGATGEFAFPWLCDPSQKPKVSEHIPEDILWDGSRIAALLDIRQIIGARNEQQERLTHILMDYDIAHPGTDYLVPDEYNPLWQTLQVSDQIRKRIFARIRRIPGEAMSHPIAWSGDNEVWVGHHRIDLRARSLDVASLKARWTGSASDPRLSINMARLLGLYSILDNPFNVQRSGLHLGIPPERRELCDYELFASPMNAVVPNGHFASKWPHAEKCFGSIGKYPSVIEDIRVGSVVCVNPPFTDAYLSDVMERLAELKLRFRLRFAVPIQEATWRKKLQKSFPHAELLHTYYDASAGATTELLHPTLYWEDPRCPKGAPFHSALPYPQGNARPPLMHSVRY